MMRHLGIQLEVEIATSAVLQKLKENRSSHARMVAEARAGYIEKARQALESRLESLRSGKCESLMFSLQMPKDYTSAYDTVISMLESHVGPSVKLNADEFRHLMEDIWDWSQEFFMHNAEYSSSTQLYGVSKGILM